MLATSEAVARFAAPVEEPVLAGATEVPPAPVIPEGLIVTSPAPAPAFDMAAWARKRRTLQVWTGVAGGISAAFIVPGALVLLIPPDCSDADPDSGCPEVLLHVVTGAIMIPIGLVALIPTIVYGVRLFDLNQTRPIGARLQLAPGGFALRF